MAKTVSAKKTAGNKGPAKKKAGAKAPKKAAAKKAKVTGLDSPVNTYALDESDYGNE